MLGDGPMFEEVKTEIVKYGMSDRFNLPGWVTPQDVLDQFSKSDILFMPSFSEGLPVVGVQALAEGLAIVARRIGGFLDLVANEQNGYLIEVHDIDAFAKSLRGLISDPELLLQFRKASIQKSREFDIQKVVDKYQAIFQSVIDEK